MTKHVGIVGCSAEGASLCYRTICAEGPKTYGDYAHPEVSMHTPPLSHYMACLERDDIEGVGDLMLASAHKLERAGADFLICPDNTIHQAFAYVETRSPLPWLHIAESVAREAASRRLRKLALLGTRWLVESDVYAAMVQAQGVDIVKPDIETRIEIDRLIFEDLVKGIFAPATVDYFRKAIGTMAGQGCDAVILGCTEIPLIIDDENSQLPVLDRRDFWPAPLFGMQYPELERKRRKVPDFDKYSRISLEVLSGPVQVLPGASVAGCKCCWVQVLHDRWFRIVRRRST